MSTFWLRLECSIRLVLTVTQLDVRVLSWTDSITCMFRESFLHELSCIINVFEMRLWHVNERAYGELYNILWTNFLDVLYYIKMTTRVWLFWSSVVLRVHVCADVWRLQLYLTGKTHTCLMSRLHWNMLS